MTIGVCDDNSIIREELVRIANNFMETSLIKYRIVAFSSGEEVLSYQGIIDILFLDIQMKGINGLKTAQKIREIDDGMLIIFLTGHKSFMLEGYKVKAFRYILKPLKEEDFVRVLGETIEELTKSTKAVVSKDSDTIFLNLKDIIYIECGGRTSLVRTKRRFFESVMTMTEWEKILNSDAFYRVHKTYIVNMEYVKEISKHIILDNGEKVELAIRQTAKFKKACKEYRKRNAR